MFDIITIAITVTATTTMIITTAFVVVDAEAPTTSQLQYIPFIMPCYCSTALSGKYPDSRIRTRALQSHFYLSLTFN